MKLSVRVFTALALFLALLAGTLAAPLTVKAPDFTLLPEGSLKDGICSFWTRGQAACVIDVAQPGTYSFIIVARGDFAGGEWPVMRVLRDGQPVLRTEVSSTNWAPYTFELELEPGQHELAMAFANDYLQGNDDRNLHIEDLSVIPPGNLPTPTILPASGYTDFLAAQQAKLREDTARRIDQIRKGDLAVTVLQADGTPATNVTVTVDMVRHAFSFGTALGSAFLEEKYTPEETSQFTDAVRHYFNHAVTENELKWMPMESKFEEVRYEKGDLLAAWCQTNGISLRGHCLFWGCEVPDWVRATPDDKLRAVISRRARNTVSYYRDTIREFDVLNEALHCPYLATRLGDSIYRQMFAEASGSNPNAALYINEYGILEGEDLDDYVTQIRGLVEAEVPVSGIGVQAHFEGAVDPERVQRALDTLAQFKLPIKITEFDCNSTNEQVQAESLENLYRVAFAHPSVAGILMWGFWEKAHWRPRAAMLRADFSKKPAAEAYEKLVLGEWWTHETGTTDHRGQFSCRSFLGTLQVVARQAGGNEASTKVELKRQRAPLNVTVTLPAANPVEATTGDEGGESESADSP